MGRLIVVGTVRRAVAGLCLGNERGRSSKPDPDRRDLLQLASKQLSQRRAVGWSGGVLQKPRWFRFGQSTCCELSTQLAIIAEATGDVSVEMDDTTRNRRQGQFKNFFYEKDDDGYSRSDIPFIAYKFYHQLHNVFKTDINIKHIATKKDGTVDISRRAFVGMELNNFEGLLRQMLAATTIHGKLRVSNGEWIFGMATREINISITPRPVQQSTVTPAARVSTDTRRQPPTIRRSDSNSSTGSNTIPDWLLLSQLSKFSLYCTYYFVIYSNQL